LREEVTGWKAAREERILLEDSKKFEDAELEAQLAVLSFHNFNVPIN
jgi:uncharacterized SAM-dependent methyltransferase